MGMNLIEFLLNARTTYEPPTPRDAAAKALSLRMSRRRKHEKAELYATIGRLMLVVEAQRRLLVQKGLCTDAEFDAMMNAVDLEDGAADGQLRPR